METVARGVPSEKGPWSQEIGGMGGTSLSLSPEGPSYLYEEVPRDRQEEESWERTVLRSARESILWRRV